MYKTCKQYYWLHIYIHGLKHNKLRIAVTVSGLDWRMHLGNYI